MTINRCPNAAEWVIVTADDELVYVCGAHLASSLFSDDRRWVRVPQRNDMPAKQCGRIMDVVLSDDTPPTAAPESPRSIPYTVGWAPERGGV